MFAFWSKLTFVLALGGLAAACATPVAAPPPGPVVAPPGPAVYGAPVVRKY